MEFNTTQLVSAINAFKEEISKYRIEFLYWKEHFSQISEELVKLEISNSKLLNTEVEAIKALSMEVDLLRDLLDNIEDRVGISDRKAKVFCTKICSFGKESTPGKHKECTICPLFDLGLLED